MGGAKVSHAPFEIFLWLVYRLGRLGGLLGLWFVYRISVEREEPFSIVRKASSFVKSDAKQPYLLYHSRRLVEDLHHSD